MKLSLVALVQVWLGAQPWFRVVDASAVVSGEKHAGHHHRHHHGHHHGHHRHHRHRHHGEKVHRSATEANKIQSAAVTNSSVQKSVVHAVSTQASIASSSVEAQIAGKMQGLERTVKSLETCVGPEQRGRLLVNAPITPDFSERFQHAVSGATNCAPGAVNVIGTSARDNDVVILDFSAPANLVHSVENQAADPDSQLANGPLRPFLLADDTPASAASAAPPPGMAPVPSAGEAPVQQTPIANDDPALPAPQADVDIDTAMPYGELEPFGREDTAQELSEQAIKESDSMVDQLERAEVAEEKRSVFRALTRLRGAAIASFDGIARSQTGNIDEYNQVHSWRRTHPLNHLADEESDVSKWAFPDDADF